MKQSRCLRFDSETRWWIQVVHQRTDTGEQMPQEQFQRVKQKQSPSAESSEEDRDSTVTACPGNNAIRNHTHEAAQDLQGGRYSQSGCCQDCQRSSQRSRMQWRKPNAAEVNETSRAKSTWHVGSNQIATVLNSIHQFKIQAHRLDRSRSAQEINKHVSDGINKDREDQRSERLQQIRSLVGRCRGHASGVVSIVEKEMTQNSAFLHKEIDFRNTTKPR